MIQPALSALLTDGEVEYLCELITPKEIKLYFQKNPAAFVELQSGFRAKALTDQRAIDLIVRNRHRNFVATFLNSFVETCHKRIHDKMISLQENGATTDVAMIQALAGSHVFSGHVELYFKLEGNSVPEEYVSLIKAAVTLLCAEKTEREDKQSSGTELANSLERVQRELAEEREAYAHTRENLIADKLVLQQELGHKQDELSEAVTKIAQMQAELERFYRREEYADILQENEAYKEYQHTSLCQVTLNSYGQIWLKRLADIYDNRLIPFRVDKSIPYGFENRDMLYKNDGPSAINYFGIWHWNTTPREDDPGKDRIDSAFDAKMMPIEIVVLSGCTKQEDIATRLLDGIPSEKLGKKMLISMLLVGEQYSGLLCNIDDFNIQHGIAKLKKSVFTFPSFHVNIRNTLIINTRIFCQNLTLDLPTEIISVKTPLALVKDIILSKTKVSTLQQQGLGVNEARRCLAYLRSLETSTLYDEVAENYGCSIEDAQEYVSEFIEQAEKSLNGSDINADVLSAVIERNSALMSKCKDMLYEEWSVENEEQLRIAQQTLAEAAKETEQQRQDAAVLKDQQDNLRQQMETLQSEISKKEALASAVEEKVAGRIAEARQNAADFISDLAFTSPVNAKSSGHNGTALSVFVRPVNASEIAATITDLSDFEDSLAENFECCGYSEERSVELSQILSFSVGRHIPIICDSNSEVIADCLAAMFGLNGATSIHISTGKPCCTELCDLLRQKKDASSPQVYLINGALDAYSPNVFNGILQNTCNLDKCILIFSSEGTPTEALPPAIWSRTMFVDGDIGLIHLPQGNLRVFETELAFCQELSPDKLKEKRKQLKPFAQIISNRALLNYSCFMVSTNSSIQSDICILTQLLLSAKASGNLENLLGQFKENGIDVEKGELSRYL